MTTMEIRSYRLDQGNIILDIHAHDVGISAMLLQVQEASYPRLDKTIVQPDGSSSL